VEGFTGVPTILWLAFISSRRGALTLASNATRSVTVMASIG
jgi:hypothetical protein